MSANSQYSYSEVGFNGFFRRSIGSDPNATTLKRSIGNGNNQINFDYSQVSGALGDTFRAGTVYVNGKTGRIFILDDQGNEVVRLGNNNG